MFKNVLIPVAPDHGVSPRERVKVARRLLSDGGQITLLAVVESVPSYVAEYVTVAPAEKIQKAVSEKLKAMAVGGANLGTAVVSGSAGLKIPDYALAHGCDLILVGSHRLDMQDYFLGSTASRVVRRSPCAVFVLRDE